MKVQRLVSRGAYLYKYFGIFKNYLVSKTPELGKCVFMATLFCTWGNCSRSNKALLMFPKYDSSSCKSKYIEQTFYFYSYVFHFTNTEMLYEYKLKVYLYVNVKETLMTDIR